MDSIVNGCRTRTRDKVFTLLDLLRQHVAIRPEKTACVYLSDDGNEHSSLDFATLDLQARAFAARLQGLDADGEAAILIYPPGLDFIVAFFGCIYAGVIAVPLPMPRGQANLAQTKGIIEDTNSEMLLSNQTFISKLQRQDPIFFDTRLCIDTRDLDVDLARAWRQPDAAPLDIAYLQYTSGSTSARKGVMISHANVIRNIQGIDRGFQHGANSVAVNWLPHFHDLGLVSGILQPLYHGATNYLMAPTALVQRPLRWLEAISKYRATHTNSPNYAYDLCIKKIADEQVIGLDLSHWRVALNGAEPVRAETVRDFHQKFEPAGLAATTMYPAYGLAEATLVVSAPLPGEQAKIRKVDSAALEHGRVVAPTGENFRELVACGRALADTEIAIVDIDTGERLDDEFVGEIWVSGPAVASGYWQNAEASEEIFAATLAAYPGMRFLRTGDLGFLSDNQLYITGRAKDLIIVRGANHYPQDIEWTVENASGSFKAGCGAAFSVAIDGEEQLVVVYEIEREAAKSVDVDHLARLAQQHIAAEHELQLSSLVLLRTTTVPRTSSGKIQRRQCKEEYLNGGLTEIARWQRAENDSTPAPTTDKDDERMTGEPRSEGAKSAESVINWLRHYAETSIDSRRYDENRLIAPQVLLDFGNQGILGLEVPRAQGGLGFSTQESLKVIEQLGAIDLTLAMMCIVHNTLGITSIQNAASEATKRALIPRLASGRELAAFAITEPTAGSNPRAIAATAEAISATQWRLNGEKIWSGNAGWAGVINVFAQHIAIDGKPSGMIGFTLPTSTPGITIGPEAQTFGMRGMVQNAVYFDNVIVEQSQLLGKPGDGMNVAQQVMQRGRLMIAAACLGGMKRCVQLMTRYAARRQISSGRLIDNSVWRRRISEINAQIEALSCFVAEVGRLDDERAEIAPDVFAALKITAPEFLWQATDSLMQLLGGRGYMEENYAPQLVRDARVARILEGPTEALRVFLGARVCKDAQAFEAFIGQRLHDNSLSDKLRVLRSEMADDYASDHAFLADVGNLGAHIMLLACLPDAAHSRAGNRFARASRWVLQQIESMHEEISNYRLSESAPSAVELENIAQEYATSIGDVEQRLAGMNTETDGLLRKSRFDDGGVGSAQNQSPPISQKQQTTATISNRSEPIPIQAASDSAAMAGFIAEWLNKELKLPANTIRISDTFFEHGVDSVTSVMLTVAIEDQFGFLPEPEVVYDYPRIDACAAEIARQMTATA